jgi:hypothetical protein
MLKVDGLSLEEIARVTSSTTGAVKQKAHRAYERLRKLLERATQGPERTPPPQSASKGVPDPDQAGESARSRARSR